MKTFLTSLILALLFAPSLARPASPGFASVRGSEIIGADGRPLHLRGVNLGNWLVPEGYMFRFKSATSPGMINEVLTQLVGPEEAAAFWREFREAYVTRRDIRYIGELGLNSVRVPFNAHLFAPDLEPIPPSAPGFAMLDSVVGWCRQEGLLVILDMHCAPGGQTGDNIDDSKGYPWLFRSPALQSQTVELWRRIAERYRDVPAVLGYDLLNEPIAPFHDTLALNPMLEPLYQSIVRAIRTVDTNHIVFLGGAQWDTNFRVFGPAFDPKIVYTFHRYWSDTTQSVIQENLDFRRSRNVPIWMGESGENNDEWVGSFRRLLDRSSVGWCFWPFKKPEAPSCPVTFRLPEGYQMVREFADAPRGSFEQIRKQRPDPASVRRVLQEFLRNCRFENCTPNPGYLRALGCVPPY